MAVIDQRCVRKRAGAWPSSGSLARKGSIKAKSDSAAAFNDVGLRGDRSPTQFNSLE
jgi:hypothetical protein